MYMQGAFALCRVLKRSETVQKSPSDLQGKHKASNALPNPSMNSMIETDLLNPSSDVSTVSIQILVHFFNRKRRKKNDNGTTL